MALPNAQFQGFNREGLWPTLLGLFVGGGNAPLKRVNLGSFTLDVGSVAAASMVETAATVTGLSVDDIVIVGDQTVTTNLLQGSIGRVSAADTLQVRSTNPTAAAIDPASKTFFYVAFRVR